MTLPFPSVRVDLPLIAIVCSIEFLFCLEVCLTRVRQRYLHSFSFIPGSVALALLRANQTF